MTPPLDGAGAGVGLGFGVLAAGVDCSAALEAAGALCCGALEAAGADSAAVFDDVWLLLEAELLFELELELVLTD